MTTEIAYDLFDPADPHLELRRAIRIAFDWSTFVLGVGSEQDCREAEAAHLAAIRRLVEAVEAAKGE